jgi:uncharacterized protein with FMN-binding domain
MRKYVQISIFLGLFALLVAFRQLHGGDENPVVGVPNNPNNPVSTNTPMPSQSAVTNTPTTGSSSVLYKEGTYTGTVEDAYYGNIQVQAVITNGKIADIVFLQYPNDNGTSRSINAQAMPFLKSEAIQAQSASVDIVSGASDSSQAFQKSLASALAQAK